MMIDEHLWGSNYICTISLYMVEEWESVSTDGNMMQMKYKIVRNYPICFLVSILL